MKKRITLFAILLALCTLFLGAVPVFAATEIVNYVDANGVKKSAECIVLQSASTVDDCTLEAGKWYFVKGDYWDYTVKNRVINNAPADDPSHIILENKREFIAPKGISNPEGKGLEIFAQSTNRYEAGDLIIGNVDNYFAGIGGDDGDNKNGGILTINGGYITVTGGSWGAGIGGGNYGNGGTVIINGGYVNVTGGERGAGIGGGYSAGSGVITINGGDVTSTGGNSGSGIGSGDHGDKENYSNNCNVTVNGGIVTAIGGNSGAGIGGGWLAGGGTVTINDGIVTATGNTNSAGIGGGGGGTGVDVAVNGGTVTAIGGTVANSETEFASGIGRGVTSDASVSHGDLTVKCNYEIKAGSADPGMTTTVADYKTERSPYVKITVQHYFAREYRDNGDGTHSQKCLFCDEYGDKALHSFENGACEYCGAKEIRSVSYIDENGMKKVAECFILENSAEVEKLTLEAGKWYAVKNTYTVEKRVLNNASEDDPAHVILLDGSAFNAPKGIRNPKGKGLCIYAQTADTTKAGKLVIDNVENYYAGIGGDLNEIGGTVAIYGGTVTTTGGNGSSGIGGGYNGEGGNTTVNGGVVTANGGYRGSGIGGGYGKGGGTTTINGGTVKANGDYYAAGIGGTDNADGGTVTVNGGIVEANGGQYGAGIGGGRYGNGGTFTANGGEITANGGGDGGSGIGGGLYGNGGTFTANGGEITAIGSGKVGAGIGGGQECTSHGDLSVNEVILGIFAGTDEGSAVYVPTDSYKKSPLQYAKIKSYPVYTVKHCQQKADGSGYEVFESETLKGVVGDETVAAAKTYDHFTSKSFDQQTILADGSTVVEIFYDRDSHTVSFDANGHGTAPSSLTALYGGTVDEPEKPSVFGYTFNGWYTDEKCTSAFDFNSPILANITLYAKWTRNTRTVSFQTNGGSEIKSQTVYQGETAIQPDDPIKKYYTFVGWYTDEKCSSPFNFGTPVLDNITLYAKWTEQICKITFDTNGGSTIDPQLVYAGKTAIKPGDPTKKGYTFIGWFADAKCSASFDFKAPVEKDTVVYAKWMMTLPFTDVKKSDWSYADISYVYENGLMNGISATKFDPKGEMTRAMIVTTLYRIEGEPKATEDITYRDVLNGMWYTKGIRWASEKGIVTGYSETKFGPNDSVTREQMALILYRYAQYKKYDVSGKADLSKFIDAKKISSWAKDAMSWANAEGFIGGTDKKELLPQGKATREQVAAVLHRFILKYES